jgi:galactokinase
VAHIPIPAGWQFVVANSLERAEKSGAAQRIYNARSRDAREAHETVNRSIVASPHEASAADRLVRGRRLLSRESFTRFRHVTTEAERVEQAARALLADDPIDFGRSMNASHDSLRDDFEVSTPALDSLCAILRAAGAVGARLTGAGLGGSVVALSSAADATLLIEALDRLYYRPAGVEPSDEVRFLVEPSAGAHVRFT